MENKKSRREFIKKSSLALAGVTIGQKGFPIVDRDKKIMGANDRVRTGFIGVGNRGTQLLHLFMEQPDCEVAALCDVYKPYITRDYSQVDPRYTKDMGSRIPQMGENFSRNVKQYTDYRKLLEDKNIDAVCIATPDHWHALQTIDAIQAGKDVYVEKPLSKTISEGRRMVEIGKKSQQVVTVGLNRRGAPTFQKLAKEIPGGKIGKVTFAQACHVSNMYPNGIGKKQAETPPADFDWNMWLGPRAYRPYQYNIAPYMFRWWEDFANQISNNGIHYLDLIRWLLDEEAPVAVSAHGGKFVIDDDRTIPDTMHVTYEFGSGALVTVSILETSSGSFIPSGFLELRGTKGTLYTGENDYKIVPTKAGQFQTWKELMAAEEFSLDKDDTLLIDGSYKNSTFSLIRNFLDCVKSRKEPWATLEIGHRSTTLAHLATIAMQTKKRLEWDGLKERFINCNEANNYLSYEYREPWKI
ncbi:MAG: Gfo/Idh/MocA family oxidoreductase [Petrimonas sp.]|jgi:predicted dehydrogenase|uniref:Gfo/Idh/MocA family protein n=1 Tax=Petrimonas sp. TaxID=2023866 RepID=UPI002B3FDFB5|nr:Gfo/Idh/MocA family oxidoreductase [Petrimonas sp.]MEA5046757.1 Gfo/Idh/MocA family oxidoreductase [Petrimonas sp.]HMM19020.1 Gfo/Idh/MocA family oxidoreductase [Petrimonas sp.]